VDTRAVKGLSSSVVLIVQLIIFCSYFNCQLSHFYCLTFDKKMLIMYAEKLENSLLSLKTES